MPLTHTSSVTEFLQMDHRRLDSIMDACRGHVASGEMKQAASVYARFVEELRRHIRIEEEILFPIFEEATGLDHNGPTHVMRAEHAEIRRLMDLMPGAFENGRNGAREFEPLRAAFMSLLHEHHGKEERILYPMTDRLVPLQRRIRLIQQMECFR